MTWAKALSLQDLGGLVGSFGFILKKKRDSARPAWPDCHFRERTPAAVSIHPDAPSFQMRKPRTQVGPSLA